MVYEWASVYLNVTTLSMQAHAHPDTSMSVDSRRKGPDNKNTLGSWTRIHKSLCAQRGQCQA